MSDQDTAEPPSASPGRPFDEERLQAERALMDADRIMLQIIQTALSLMGVGVTIYTLFSGWAVRGIVKADQVAKNLGLSLLAIGLLLLITGIGSQARFRFALMRRAKQTQALTGAGATPVYHVAPTFLIAALLLLVGLAAFAAIVGEMFSSSRS